MLEKSKLKNGNGIFLIKGRNMLKGKWKIALLAGTAMAGAYAGTPDASTDAMLKAYADLNYSRARSLAARNMKSPQARLVTALCMIHDNGNQNIEQAFKELRGLIDDKQCPAPVKLQAMFAYARTAQLMQERPEVFKHTADNIKPEELYRQIIKLAPESREACSAALFIAYPYILSGDKAKIAEGFKSLEDFCTDFKGDKKLLVPIHLFAELQYILLNNDYKSSLRHLLAAYNSGIANPKNEPVYLYRIARIYDTKLKDPQNAMKYYREFLKRYPHSAYAPMVKRFADEKDGKGGSANGEK